ncbi:unannotated protein [freshwater metagenome]|uniref:Unannotated protein n=1 Tax=freshwater metagenome TaxID=449393 RepID=A0A6J7N1M9_9ZZZZ|nr:hypothetical protein [Actinomycetota bacterium]MSW26969.1 hypothetical protein [Actinomycetota bacterium]MSW34779.1 hypothetical protein [Actinomycetota bacterium]MSX31803.1 hypothetical protein [Actinomycetota bacterium]MSX51958.1 hypothetical protein [Actinomycetota bacterium]
MKALPRCIKWNRKDFESGSASVEFVILAIPLFLPIFIFLNQFSEVSNEEANARTLVGEVVRAYATSQNLGNAQARAEVVLNYGASRLGFSRADIDSMKLTFTCSSSSCTEPGERVRADLTMTLPITHRVVHASAQEYVSPWQ